MFEWDEAKRAANLAKHGVDFDAAPDFEFGTALVWTDDRRDYGEVRLVAIGFIGPRLHVLTFTPRGETTRIISLRKANPREIQRYVDS